MTPVLLAFDTSTEALAVGLQWPGGRRIWNGEGGAQASASLLPTVQRLLGDAGLALAQVDAIAFGCGPGAFTGLRTACSVAQGLAFGADKPVLAIDSLLIVAEDERARRGDPAALDVAVAMDARMGELYAARYRWRGGRWEALQLPGLWAPATWWQDLQEAAGQAEPGGTPALAWGGSGMVMVAEVALARARDLARDLAQVRSACTDRAAALLRLADQAWHAGQAVPAEQALPVYLRDKVALTTAERLALKEGT
ncbi:MAG: tRNA (adenosine(37)-N6)-threonylcarbamoyltransferase complex dimerization subunit type 1 TsaB [Betaproteobacteria bacterium]|jgi:tRNA threonylcarbamoyladenosine biosynthesis protein TsaB